MSRLRRSIAVVRSPMPAQGGVRRRKVAEGSGPGKKRRKRKITGPIVKFRRSFGQSGSLAQPFLGESGFRHAQSPSRKHL